MAAARAPRRRRKWRRRRGARHFGVRSADDRDALVRRLRQRRRRGLRRWRRRRPTRNDYRLEVLELEANNFLLLVEPALVWWRRRRNRRRCVQQLTALPEVGVADDGIADGGIGFHGGLIEDGGVEAAATVERGSSEVVVANVVAVHDDDVDVGGRPVVDGRPAILEGIQEVWVEGCLRAEF